MARPDGRITQKAVGKMRDGFRVIRALVGSAANHLDIATAQADIIQLTVGQF